MQFALCNEVLGELPFARQCELIAALGYQGIELAPFTLGEDAHLLPAGRRRAPGQGSDDFGPILSALKAVGYSGPVSVEPFIYEPDGPTTAARAIGYLQGLLEGIRAKENEESA